jgi:hypothetical protein
MPADCGPRLTTLPPKVGLISTLRALAVALTAVVQAK